jgi:vancomycin permeability regulator SanA
MLKIVIFIVLFFLILEISIFRVYSDKIYTNIEDLEKQKTAIVFGSGVDGQGGPSLILQDRILAAVELYKQGVVQQILISGDARFVNFDEVTAMKNYLLDQEVPEYIIIEDRKGYRTYDTCLRAKAEYQINKAILVTQEFHQPRALYTCNSLGVESVGYAADNNIYEDIRWFSLRERFAMISAIWDVVIARPKAE